MLSPTKSHIRTLLPAIALVALALPASASAQASRTWVSGVGDDANPCSRTAPCKTFAGAISKTAPGGEINCLDPGGFGGVTITKAMTIKCHYTEGGVLVSGTNAIVINAGTGDVVTLRGLDINGLNTGLNGVRILQAKRVRILDSEIYEFAQNGIDFEPANNGAKLFVTRTHIHDNTGNGVLNAPQTGVTSTATLRYVEAQDNACGTLASTFGANTSFGANCGAGTVANGSTGAVTNSFHSQFSDSPEFGVFSRGTNAVQRIGDDDVTGNFQGLLVLNSGQILSFKNNYVDGNGTNGAPTGTVNQVRRSRRH
jgi:hypothetical protein